MAWVEKDHNARRVSAPLLCAGSPTSRPGCPEPHPAWPQMPPGMGHPQPPGAACSSVMNLEQLFLGSVEMHYKNCSWEVVHFMIVMRISLSLFLREVWMFQLDAAKWDNSCWDVCCSVQGTLIKAVKVQGVRICSIFMQVLLDYSYSFFTGFSSCTLVVSMAGRELYYSFQEINFIDICSQCWFPFLMLRYLTAVSFLDQNIQTSGCNLLLQPLCWIQWATIMRLVVLKLSMCKLSQSTDSCVSC